MEAEVDDDDQLLGRCQRGDDVALAELVARQQDRIFHLAYRVLQDAARAEDATADALVAIWTRCRTWRREAAATTWIQQVAWRVVLDHYRRRRRWWRFWDAAKFEKNERVSDPAAQAAGQDEQASLALQLAAAIAELSAEERAIIQFHYYEQQGLAQIAEVLGISHDALKMRLSRARKRLRAIWEKQHEP